MTIEQRLEKVEKQNKRQRLAVLVLAVALCGMVSMAATGKLDLRGNGDLKVDGIRADHIRSMGMVVLSDWYKTDGWARVTGRVDSENNGQLLIFNKNGHWIPSRSC